MRIELDDKHVLCSDKWCCWVMEKRIEKKTGKPYEFRITGYFHSFEQLVLDHFNQKIIGSDAESIKELAREVKAAKEELKTWIKNGSSAAE